MRTPRCLKLAMKLVCVAITQLHTNVLHLAVMIREHECWQQSCEPWIITNNISVGLFAYPMDMFQYEDLATRRTFVNTPQCGHIDYFLEQNPSKKRDIDALVAGSISETYPLRSRFKEFVSSGKVSGVYRPHPGYFCMSYPKKCCS